MRRSASGQSPASEGRFSSRVVLMELRNQSLCSVLGLLLGAGFVAFFNEYESGNKALLLNSVSPVWQWLVTSKCVCVLTFPLTSFPIQNSPPAASTLGNSCPQSGLLKNVIHSRIMIIIKLAGLNLKPSFLPQCRVLTAEI